MTDAAVVSDKHKHKETAKDAAHEPAGSDLSRHVLDPKHVTAKTGAADTEIKKPAADHPGREATQEVHGKLVPEAQVAKDGSLHFNPTPPPADAPVPAKPEHPPEAATLKPEAPLVKPDPKAAEVEKQRLATAATDLHEAVNKSTLLVFNSPDVPKIMNIIEPMSAAQRKQVEQEYAAKFPGKDLLADLKGKLSGPDAARAEAILKRQDGVADNSGQIHEALAKIKALGPQLGDEPEVARVRAEKEIRDAVDTLPKDQLSAVEAKYKKDYGSDLQTDLQSNALLSDASKSALRTYMTGADHRSDQNTLKLANDALTNQRPDIFNEALRDASPAARQAFLKQDGITKIDQAFSGADAKIAKDFAERGEPSLSTIISGDTHWYHTNHDDITRAIKDVSTQDRADYIRGEQISKLGMSALSADDKRAADTYKSVNDALNNGGNERQADLWRTQLKSQESITQGLLEAKSDGVAFGLGSSVDKNKAFAAVENMSEKDFNFLRSHPDAVAQIAETADKYDKQFSNRIVDALYDKLAAKDYESSKATGVRPLTERLSDNSDNTANRIDALSSMNAAERYSYNTNAKGYGTYIDSLLKSDEEKTFTARMAAKSGPPDATDQVLIDGLKGNAALKTFKDVEAAMTADPTLKARLENPFTAQDKALAKSFHSATHAAIDKAGLGDQVVPDTGTVIPGQYDSYDDAVFKNGKVPIDLKLQLTSDRQEQIDSIMHATDDEKSRLLSTKPDAATKSFQDSVLGTNEAERQVILNGLQQKDADGHTGFLTATDKMRLLAVDGANADDMKQMLSGMTPSQRQDLADDYYTKYKSIISADTVAKVAPDEQWRFKELLAPTDLNVRQIALDAQQSNDSHASEWDQFLKNNWDYSRVAADSSQDKLTKFAAEHADELSKLSPEQRKQFDDAVQNYTKAEKAYVESKGQFADTFVNATLTVAAVGGAAFSGGTSLALLGAVGGAGARLALMSSIEGSDFDSSAKNLAKQAFEGGAQGALGFLAPEQLGVTMSLKVGGDLAAASAAKIVSGSAEAMFKEGSESVLKDGLASLTRQGAIAGDKSIAALADRVAAEGVDKEVVRQVIANQIKSDTMTGIKNIALNEGEAYAKSMLAAQIGSQGKEIAATAAGFESPQTLLERMKNTAVSTAVGVTMFHGVFKLGAAKDYAKVALGLDAQGRIVAGEGTVIKRSDGSYEPVVGKDKLVRLNAGDAIYEKGAYKELADGSKSFTVGNTITRYDASGKVIQTGDLASQHSMDYSYLTNPRTNQPEIDKVTAYKPDGSIDATRSLVREGEIYYRQEGWLKAPVGTEVNVGADGTVTIKGQAKTSNGTNTEIGRGRTDAANKDEAIDLITYNANGTRTYHSVDNFSITRDGSGRPVDVTDASGGRRSFEYKGPNEALSNIQIGDHDLTLQNGKWLDKNGKQFAASIDVLQSGSLHIIEPADTLRTPTRPNESVKDVWVLDKQTQYTHKDSSAATTDAVPPPEKLSQADYFKQRIQSGEVVQKADGTSYSHNAQTGADSYFDKTGKLVAQRTVNGERHFEYDKNGAVEGVIYAKNGVIESSISKRPSSDGLDFQEIDAKGKVIRKFAKLSVDDDGSITKLGGINKYDEWTGIKERPDGLKIDVNDVGKETINGADLGRERMRVQTLARDGFNDPARQERFEKWTKDFEQAATRRQPPLSDTEIANTYYQLDKLMTKDNSVLPHDERLKLAEQFMYKAANPNTIGQGIYSTCNVTAEIEHRFTVLHPADALRLVTDVATTGRFVTDSGSVIDMTAMKNVMRPLPGVVENEFNPTNYGGRDMFDQLFQSTAVEIHWQTQTTNGARPTSTIWDLRAGDPYRPGDLRYEFTASTGRGNSGEVINDFSTNPPTRKLAPDFKTMVDPLSGKLQTVVEWKPAQAPNLSGTQLLSVGKEILGHAEPPHMIARTDEPAAVKVYSADEMIEKLKEMQAAGGTPTTVFVDTKDPIFNNDSEQDAQYGGAHVINVQKIELRGNQYFVEYTNQWSTKDDRLGEKAIPAEALFRAMQYRKPTVAQIPGEDVVAPTNRSTPGDIAKGVGIGAGISAVAIGGAYGAYQIYDSTRRQ